MLHRCHVSLNRNWLSPEGARRQETTIRTHCRLVLVAVLLSQTAAHKRSMNLRKRWSPWWEGVPDQGAAQATFKTGSLFDRLWAPREIYVTSLWSNWEGDVTIFWLVLQRPGWLGRNNLFLLHKPRFKIIFYQRFCNNLATVIRANDKYLQRCTHVHTNNANNWHAKRTTYANYIKLPKIDDRLKVELGDVTLVSPAPY